jgi:UDP-N-acetylglucosamine 2-epimerase (hydrolysing)
MLKKKIIFVTGTRADYGKLKSIIVMLQKNQKFQTYVFVTGMHNLKDYGKTYVHLVRDKIQNIFRYKNQNIFDEMDIIVSKTIVGFSDYLNKIKPDLVVVHGDRVEPLACSISACLNNYLVAHIEGGEVSGSVDEILRHSISKLSHVHFVSNYRAKKRLCQLGELKKNIYVIGSPDVDLLYSDLPNIIEVKKRYNIEFLNFGIVLFHPDTLSKNNALYSKILVNSLIKSKFNYVVIYPNNDLYSREILETYKILKNLKNFRLISSMRFEYFLSLLKNSNFLIGNSSSGIREAPYYGVPTINLGLRQKKRSNLKTIINCDFNESKIITIIKKLKIKKRFKKIKEFGSGDSDKKFLSIILKKNFWNTSKHKQFQDIY